MDSIRRKGSREKKYDIELIDLQYTIASKHGKQSEGKSAIKMLKRIVGLPTRRYFHRTSFLLGGDFETVHIPNTNHFKDLLIEKGKFQKDQATTIVEIMTDAIRGGVSHVSQDLAKREKLTQLSYQQRVDFAKLRDQLLSADRSEFHNIQNEYESVKNDLEKLKNKLREEITKTNAGFKLDLSLEKGRIREESSHHDLQIKEIDTKIEQEVTNMKMQIDSVKTQVMQWLIGVCTGTFALVLAYMRLLT